MPQKRTRNTPPARPSATTPPRRASRPASASRPQKAGKPMRGNSSASGAHSARSVTPRTNGPADIEVNVPGAGEVLLTRRHFLYGVAGVAAITALGGGYAYMQSNEDAGDVEVLDVPENAVFTSEDCTQIEDAATAMSLSASVELPYGSLLWANDDIAACLLPTETSKPLAQIALLALGTGTCTTVVSNAVGESEGFEIYDVRACANGIIWTEADILEGVWRVYHASSNGSSIGAPVLAEEGGNDWEMPALAAVGSHAFWQCVPRKDGSAKTEDSLLKRAAFGASDPEIVYASHGRMATAPYAGKSSVTITPRADTSGTYYQLTNIDASSGEVTDALVLPASMKPLEAGYGDTGFTFSFESIYNYGGGIANLGTYVPASKVETGVLSNSVQSSSVAEGEGDEPKTLAEKNALVAASAAKFEALPYSDATWFRFPRTPTAAPSWCGSWFMVKSTSAVCGIDFANKQYFAFDVQNGATDYGDYLASSGSASRVVTYSNIDHTPLGGSQIKQCLVRIWQPL